MNRPGRTSTQHRSWDLTCSSRCSMEVCALVGVACTSWHLNSGWQPPPSRLSSAPSLQAWG
eukprot:8580-Eustigmatos_ZCMA.PRE.1